jgi:hypothetical protein
MRVIYLYLITILLSFTVQAQNAKPTEKITKSDIVLKVNGDEMIGKITSISDNEIKFIYEGETLEYSIKKTDILKVTYSSGRVEFFNKQPLPSEVKIREVATSTQTSADQAKKYAIASGDHHNKVAILPFGYLRDGQPGAKEISLKVQTDAYSFLAKHSAGYTLLDPRTTNALLIKAGVTRDNLEGFTWDEICNILGVEYIVEGTVNIVKGMQSSSSNSSFNASSNNNNKSFGNGNTKAYGSTTSTSAQYYETSVVLNVFTDKNQNIYTENHKAFLNSTNAQYNTTLQYLLKRIPIYRK